MAYNFSTQLAVGQHYEDEIDAMFADRFTIQPATPQQQRQGIDRIYRHWETPHRPMTVEYKADETAAQTGNAFVETISVDVSGRPGWAVTSQAEWLFYSVPGSGQALYIIRLADLRKHLPDWKRQYEERRIANNGYHTVGLLVPLYEFERVACAVL